MTTYLRCVEYVEQKWIARYVANRLAVAEALEFEEHLVGCERCQQEVQLAVAVSAALRRPLTRAPRRSHAVTWMSIVAAAGLLAIVVPRAMRWSSDTAALGRVGTPPVYAGAPVRAAARPADSLFVASMASYAAGAYERAERGLRAALAAGVDTVPVEFFRGASLLMLGRPREATVAFEHVIAAGPSAYVDEARYYRAKSLLAQGQHAAALIELRLLQRSPSDAAAAAGRLADSVEARLKR